MAFDPYKTNLPVVDIIPQVKKDLNVNNSLILHAPPGAGKSTLIPLVLKDETWLKGKKILMLEPRRLAAKSIASRMANLLGEPVGQNVGYRIRFENKATKNTQIEVLTEGIMTRMIHQDNALEEVGLVIFDEFHERNIHADVAMALCREVQEILRPDLKILVMSATLDMPQLSSLLNAPIAESKGRQYPVEIIHTHDADSWTLPEQVAQTIKLASKEKTGDILAFLPGQREIKKTQELLQRMIPEVSIFPLYGQLSPQRQQQAILPHPNGKRKVVLATSIAETSLTIEGVSIVVDSGFGRTAKFDPKSGLSRLETVKISKDAADQRAGRAGRLGPGTCYRLWTKATEDRLAPFRVPEILEADLASLCLDLVQWGIKDIPNMTWLTPPPNGALSQAQDLLEQLGAIADQKLTKHGEALRNLPCHPRIAHMLLKAQSDGNLALATDIAAILEEKDPLPPNSGTDINLRIEALRRHRSTNKQGRGFERIEKVAGNYRRLFDIPADNVLVDSYESGLILTYAYPERIAHARPGNNAQFKLTNGKIASMYHKDELAHEPWLSIAHVDARDGMGKIFMAAPLNPKDLAPLIQTDDVVTWDYKNGNLVAEKQWRIGHIVLQSKPLPTISATQKTAAIEKAIQQDGSRLLDFNESVQQWQNRVLSLRKWTQNNLWPDVSIPSLLQNTEWIAPYLDAVTCTEDFRKLNLLDILHYSLGMDQQQQLEHLAPSRIEVPSGSKIKLHYHPNGEPPVLAVRLQEVFGMMDTPTIHEGKQGVLMHLLSPGFKPVQVTSDLRSFWENTYFEVKKELKRRYPKHYWPDNPLDAEAVRGVKRKYP
ncbi:ATP-dependent helicase HrpB [Echinicola strongylocentroti]|uniref:ATP-dependent helicase HrpB n=1 Tax=Echinicola strongylocentroti TaxID=1795355 RepID=A0A2Z4ICP0_9BACT|nr:ATP-dependent helicase HrpB [Echinicola strongylocentroti]AWW28741.1 ATP-dependent helicase HrpB [Echinicola strongylocentroti]